MKCLILAAGYATRLYPLTENFPKPLLEVGGKPIIDRLVDDLAALPETEGFLVVTNHKFAPHFARWQGEKAKVCPCGIAVLDDGTSTNEGRLGAVRDMQLALGALGDTDSLLVMAGDNALDFSLAGFAAFARERQASCVMCYEEQERDKLQKTAVVTVDGAQRITSYEEKPLHPRGNLAVPPFYYYRAQDAARGSEALASGCGGDAPGSFAAWLSRRVPMYAYRMPGRRYDIGDIPSYEYAQRVLSQNETKGAGRT